MSFRSAFAVSLIYATLPFAEFGVPLSRSETNLMSTIVLIRPGCTDFDEQQRVQGALNLPLNARGERQVQQTLADLRSVPIDVIYASPCEPAGSTAALIGTRLGIPVKESGDLRNLNQGLWQGLQVEEIRRKHPKVFKQWQEMPETICPPGGEMLPDVVVRVRKALEKPLKKRMNFAIVASEPLASVIGHLIRGEKLESLPAIMSCSDAPKWEYLSTNGHHPAHAGEAAADGCNSSEKLDGPRAFASKPLRAGSESSDHVGPELNSVKTTTRGGSPDEFSPET